MIVTEIIPLDKRKSKVLLDEDLALVLYRGELKPYGIIEGGSVSQDTYDEIISQVLLKRARDRAFYILKASDKTEQQLRKKLEGDGYPACVIDEVLDFLKRYHYIDDENYGRRYVEIQKNRKSRRQISCDLQQRGLSRELISQLLEEQPVEEAQQIRKFLQKKGWASGVEMEQKQRQKLYGSLLRKGFSYDAIRKVMGEEE